MISLDNPECQVPFKNDSRPVCLDFEKMTEKKMFFETKYVPEYAVDYFSKRWYK